MRARRAICGLAIVFLVNCADPPSHTGTGGTPPDTTVSPVAQTVGSSASMEPTSNPWARAASIRYLPLDSFPDLPQWARTELEVSGCTVAQAFHTEAAHNVIPGEFASPGQVDWAALCARGDSTHIVVAWGGPERCPTPIAVDASDIYLQKIDKDQIGFSRLIGSITNESIRTLAAEFDGPQPPSIDHDGINDAFVEKGSIVHYCHDVAWHRLSGID